MTFKLIFTDDAKKEWRKIAPTIKTQFVKKLAERLENPHVSSAKLSGLTNGYKIKLRSAGYRLVYQVIDDVLVVCVIAVGKRENNEVYDNLSEREINKDEIIEQFVQDNPS